MKKLFKLMLMVLIVISATTTVLAEGDSNTTDVKFTTSTAYEWSVPAGDSTTPHTITGSAIESLGSVSVSSLILESGKKLTITISSDFELACGDNKLSYEISKTDGSDQTTNKWAALETNGTILEINAGTDVSSAISQELFTKVTGTAIYAGDYVDTITFTAAVVDQVTE